MLWWEVVHVRRLPVPEYLVESVLTVFDRGLCPGDSTVQCCIV
jgi:hypothetical protein